MDKESVVSKKDISEEKPIGDNSVISEDIIDNVEDIENTVLSDEVTVDRGAELDTNKYDKIFDDFIYFSSFLTGKNKLSVYFDGISSENNSVFMITKFPKLSTLVEDFIKRNNNNPEIEDLSNEKISSLLTNSVDIFSLKLVKRGMYNKKIPIYILQDLHSQDKFIIEIECVKKLSEMGFKFNNQITFVKSNNKLYFVFKSGSTTIYCIGYYIPSDKEVLLSQKKLSTKDLMNKLEAIL